MAWIMLGPSNDQTVMDHLNTKPVRYSDPHCNVKYIKPDRGLYTVDWVPKRRAPRHRRQPVSEPTHSLVGSRPLQAAPGPGTSPFPRRTGTQIRRSVPDLSGSKWIRGSGWRIRNLRCSSSGRIVPECCGCWDPCRKNKTGFKRVSRLSYRNVPF